MMLMTTPNIWYAHLLDHIYWPRSLRKVQQCSSCVVATRRHSFTEVLAESHDHNVGIHRLSSTNSQSMRPASACDDRPIYGDMFRNWQEIDCRYRLSHVAAWMHNYWRWQYVIGIDTVTVSTQTTTQAFLSNHAYQLRSSSWALVRSPKAYQAPS